MRVATPLPPSPRGYLSRQWQITIQDELVGLFEASDDSLLAAGNIDDPSNLAHSVPSGWERPSNYLIARLAEGQWRTICRLRSNAMSPQIDVLGERVVFAPARQRGERCHAMLIDRGQALATFPVGDDIEAIHFSRTGEIWIVYGDESIFYGDQLCSEVIANIDSNGVFKRGATSDGGLYIDIMSTINVGMNEIWASSFQYSFM